MGKSAIDALICQSQGDIIWLAAKLDTLKVGNLLELLVHVYGSIDQHASSLLKHLLGCALSPDQLLL